MSLANTPEPIVPPTATQVAESLDFQHADLLRLRNAKLQALAELAKACPRIDDGDDTEAGIFADTIAEAKTLTAAAKRAHGDAKQPWLAGGKAVDGWLKRFTTPVETALAPLQKTLLDFLGRKEAAARAAAQREAEAAEQAAHKAALAAARAARKGQDNTETLATAERAMATAAAAREAAEGKAATLTQVRGAQGASTSITTRWDYEIEDFDLIPVEFKMINDEAIEAAKKLRDPLTGQPKRVIPGLRWVKVASLGVR